MKEVLMRKQLIAGAAALALATTITTSSMAFAHGGGGGGGRSGFHGGKIRGFAAVHGGGFAARGWQGGRHFTGGDARYAHGGYGSSIGY
jgi:hypothetical protein